MSCYTILCTFLNNIGGERGSGGFTLHTDGPPPLEIFGCWCFTFDVICVRVSSWLPFIFPVERIMLLNVTGFFLFPWETSAYRDISHVSGVFVKKKKPNHCHLVFVHVECLFVTICIFLFLRTFCRTSCSDAFIVCLWSVYVGDLFFFFF